MAYKALYRKYRPSNFDGIVGQDSIVKILKNIIKTNKISHAYLFSGPRGTGKTSIAKLFAKSVNCLSPKEGLACNNCENCKYIENENVTDIIEIDAASNNGVDEIRELKNKVNLVPSKCKYKVYIIDEVHMLSMGAFNALLKTLEEPPKHIIFILATTEIQKVPLTILSRCQNFNFKKITADKIKERLNYIIKSEDIKIDEEAIEEIANNSDGGMRDAIGLLEQAHSFSDGLITLEDIYKMSGVVSNNKILELVTAIIKNDVNQVFDYVNEYYQDGKDFVKITENIILFYKNILLYKKAPKYFDKKQDNKLYESVSSLISTENIYVCMAEINNSLTNMQTSGHPKILFEIMLLKLINSDEVVNLIDKESEKDPHNRVKELTQSAPIIKTEKIKEEPILKKDKGKELEKIFVQAIINNTLLDASKENLNEFNEKWIQLNTYLINKDFKDVATILLDSKVAAASKDHVILIYKYDNMVDKTNEAYEKIEKFINQVMGRKYIMVALTEIEWSALRPYYIKLKKENKKIEFLPEEDYILSIKNLKIKEKSINKNLETAVTDFGQDLIEMKG